MVFCGSWLGEGLQEEVRAVPTHTGWTAAHSHADTQTTDQSTNTSLLTDSIAPTRPGKREGAGVLNVLLGHGHSRAGERLNQDSGTGHVMKVLGVQRSGHVRTSCSRSRTSFEPCISYHQEKAGRWQASGFWTQHDDARHGTIPHTARYHTRHDDARHGMIPHTARYQTWHDDARHSTIPHTARYHDATHGTIPDMDLHWLAQRLLVLSGAQEKEG